MTVDKYTGEYETAAEYAEAVRLWLLKCYHFHCASASFPYFLASLQAQAANHTGVVGNQSGLVSPSTTTSSTSTGSSTTTTTTTTTNSNSTNTSPTPNTNTNTDTQERESPRRGVEYKIPALWKRVVAEIFDFVLMFLVKLMITYVVVDTFDLFESIKKYDFDNIRADILSDYRLALNMTSEILILELIHRIGTCIFEALCLHRGRGVIGGATPGKKLFGLRVIRCEWMAPTLNDLAIVYPASDIGFSRALLRSVVKNFSLTFLFPICFTLFTFQHNRTLYDFLAGSVVVEVRNR